MKRMTLLFTLLGLCSGAAHAALLWQPAPPEPTQQGGAHQGHGGQRGGKPFLLQEGAGAEAEIWLPTLVRRPLQVDESGRVLVGGTGSDNYHLLYAKKVEGNREQVALRYHYQHGKPSEASPALLVNQDKTALEIIPAPLTREHQRYTSLKSHDFIVRFDGKPLAGHPVTLRSSNGSEINGETDRKGRITFHLPDDFTDVKPGRSNNSPAEFVLGTAHEMDGRSYQTTLSAPYYVSPSHWRSTGGGLMAMLVGVVTGFVVLRRSQKSSDKAGRA
ncbi:MAG: DUF4198 domain-containing protein [Gammaproteobacteria bacterium]|nr:DUF4198 domain-containing protein [Gammaproteobacteria bacterium]